MKVKIRGALFHCACGKSYSNPLGHVCTTGRDFRRRGATHKKQTAAAGVREKKAAARAKETAGRRARRQREDEGRRARRAKETAATRTRKKAAASRPVHRYEACRDEDCKRVPCTAWRDGRREGYRDGFEDGYDGGYSEGYIAGVQGCPRGHI